MTQEFSESTQKVMVCPPLRKALSTPAMVPVEEIAHGSFPAELRNLVVAARKGAELPERWMCVVVRREVMTKAVGRIVHVRQIPTISLG